VSDEINEVVTNPARPGAIRGAFLFLQTLEIDRHKKHKNSKHWKVILSDYCTIPNALMHFYISHDFLRPKTPENKELRVIRIRVVEAQPCRKHSRMTREHFQVLRCEFKGPSAS
jgi:hypothetical protein